MKSSLINDILFGIGIFALIALAMLLGGQMPQFVYVMF